MHLLTWIELRSLQATWRLTARSIASTKVLSHASYALEQVHVTESTDLVLYDCSERHSWALTEQVCTRFRSWRSRSCALPESGRAAKKKSLHVLHSMLASASKVYARSIDLSEHCMICMVRDFRPSIYPSKGRGIHEALAYIGSCSYRLANWRAQTRGIIKEFRVDFQQWASENVKGTAYLRRSVIKYVVYSWENLRSCSTIDMEVSY